ncbi:MAG: AI-2E family transporter, partial [Pseudomonadota bacterium]
PRFIVAIGAVLLIGFIVYLIRSALMPFALGIVIAYLLDPVADWLERRGIGRGFATLFILIFFFGVVTFAVMTLVPLLGPQLGRLIQEFPGYLSRLSDMVSPMVNQALGFLDENQVQDLQQAATGYADVAAGWAWSLLQRVWAGGLALIDLISLFVITPMVAFYMLRDFDKIVERLASLVPKPYLETVSMLARESDQALGRFLRGQALVALLLAAYFAIALTLADLRFGLVIGIMAGLLNIVPFVGSIVGFTVSMSVAVTQFDSWVMWVVIAAIFVAGQVVEGNFITPRLIGDAVGLHPVWIIFALMAGGNLFGITGVMLAVPAAAVIGVVLRHSLARYRASHFYVGSTKE